MFTSILKTTILASIVFSTSLSAVTFDVIGACSSTPLYEGRFRTDIGENVGVLSMEFFEDQSIPYSGSEAGFSSINHSPEGLLAIEVLSDTKMRAYGWCFSVNGVVPNTLANETYLKKQNDYISWFYAYSTYDQGVWTDYCVPSHKIKAPQFCK